MSPSRIPVISQIPATFLERSRNLDRCTMRSMPEAICARMAGSGSSIPIITMVSSLRSISRALLA